MARLFADENFPRPVVEELRRLGHDVLTMHDAGKAGQSLTDLQVLSYATDNVRAVVTLNRKHFVRLHAASSEHAGLVVCSFDADFTAQAQRIHAAISAERDLRGRLLRVNRA
jgi:hypothetical protein